MEEPYPDQQNSNIQIRHTSKTDYSPPGPSRLGLEDSGRGSAGVSAAFAGRSVSLETSRFNAVFSVLAVVSIVSPPWENEAAFAKERRLFLVCVDTVSYTHLTLPTIA